MHPFSVAAVNEFVRQHPELERLKELLTEAADAFLYRFDPHISAEFVNGCLSKASGAVAEELGFDSSEAHGRFLRSVTRTLTAYFAERWDDADAYVKTNEPRLFMLRKKYKLHTKPLSGVQRDPAVIEIDDVGAFEAILESKQLVIAKFYADYCSSCARMAPEFEAAAQSLRDVAVFIAINGPENTMLKERYKVQSYPTVRKFLGGVEIAQYPSGGTRTAKRFIDFAVASPGTAAGDFEDIPKAVALHKEGNCDANTFQTRRRESEVATLGQYAEMLRRQGIDELEELVHDRQVHVHVEIDKAISCGGNGCDALPARTREIYNGGTPPLAVFLGGGMGAGKSTVVKALSRTKFWRAYGASVVVVEADAFKMHDPMFTALQSVDPALASCAVHSDSLAAADELFLKAVMNRRDVVLDGTMAWAPYVLQTLSMLRDNEHVYRRGPGYSKSCDGTVTESYWEKGERRPFSVPAYRIEIVGVTVEPAVAVQRGIIRRILSGRGVPVRSQLESHRLFSENFERYADLFDAAYLFDMSLQQNEYRLGEETPPDTEGKDHRRIIAWKPGILFPSISNSGQKLRIINSDAYKLFSRKRCINSQASGVKDLYSVSHANNLINQ